MTITNIVLVGETKGVGPTYTNLWTGDVDEPPRQGEALTFTNIGAKEDEILVGLFFVTSVTRSLRLRSRDRNIAVAELLVYVKRG